MPAPYTTLNARVKQKIATEAYWLSIEDELGVIFEGEQAFVFNDAGLPVNFKIGDGTKKFSELPYFITYMSGIANLKVLSYLDQSDNITIPITFRNQSFIKDVILINNSGADVTVKIGTTDGGNEVLEITIPEGPVNIDTDYLFTSSETVYITGLDAALFSLFIIYVQMDESPVAPSGGGSGGITSAYNNGTVYAFLPSYAGHANICFDFITGVGKVGTPYAGCLLYGTNGLPSLEDFYLKGYKIGDTLGGTYGTTNKEIAIETENLPPIELLIGKDRKGGNSGSDILSALEDGPFGQNAYELGGTSEPIEIQPLSKSVLYFTGPLTT